MARVALALSLLVWAGRVEAGPVTWPALAPQVYAGLQIVAPWRTLFTTDAPLAVTGLLLWPLPRRLSVQVQVIQPVTSSGLLVRVGVDVRIDRWRP